VLREVIRTMCDINFNFIRVICDLKRGWREPGSNITLMKVTYVVEGHIYPPCSSLGFLEFLLISSEEHFSSMDAASKYLMRELIQYVVKIFISNI
jgi:hypothetical protein